MGILNIRPVVRGGSKVVIGIAGVTGSGKTLTALYIARGMVSKPSEIGFLDTENGRGSYYADKLDGKFMIADLYPPFSPARYAAAFKEFQEAGVKVLVVDSVSHEWEGEGGCEDIADQKMGTSNRANWVGAKKQHKRFMNTALQSNMHIIFCIRAREKSDFKNPDKPVSLGIQPICEKNFMFEMTASVMIKNEGKGQDFLKVPNFLREAFGSGADYLGQETGKKILAWAEGAEREDPVITKIKSEMLQACEFGLAGVIAIWNSLTKSQKQQLAAHKEVCKQAAEEYERQAKEAEETPQETLKREQAANGKQVNLDMP
jgi:hypothetical protein